jgi:subtilisin family serine protease
MKTPPFTCWRAALLGAALVFAADSARSTPIGTLPDGRLYIKNEILISLTEDFARQLSVTGARRRAVSTGSLRGLDADADAVVGNHTAAERWLSGQPIPARVRRLGLPASASPDAVPAIARMLTIKLREGGDAARVLPRVRRNPRIEWADLNFLAEPDTVPNDTSWASQWGPARIGMVEAWSVSQTVTNLRVAIVDTGVDRTHYDLSNAIVYGRSFNTNNIGEFQYGETGPGDCVRTNLGSPSPSAGDVDHGTHVAGIAAAIRNNNAGIAGVARAGIMAMGCGNPTLLTNTNSTTGVITTNTRVLVTRAADAICDAVANGAHIINCSFTYATPSPGMSNALTKAQNAGVTVVASAGNAGANISSSANAGWAAHPWPVIVGNTSTNDTRASNSNFGPEMDLAAPGTLIPSTVSAFQSGAAGVRAMSGTSMAAPHVAGAAIYLRSLNPDRLGGAGTMDLIYRMAEDLGPAGRDDDFGRGLLRLRPEFLRVATAATTFAGRGALRDRFTNILSTTNALGSYDNPYSSVTTALANTPAGGVLVLNAGPTNVASQLPPNTKLTNRATLTAFPDRPVTLGGH